MFDFVILHFVTHRRPIIPFLVCMSQIQTPFGPFVHPKLSLASADGTVQGPRGRPVLLMGFLRPPPHPCPGARIVPIRSASRNKTTSKSSLALLVIPPAASWDNSRSGENYSTLGKFTPFPSASRRRVGAALWPAAKAERLAHSRTLTRVPRGSRFRAAFGVRRVHRRFLTHGRPTKHRKASPARKRC